MVQQLQEIYTSSNYEALVRRHLTMGEATDDCRAHYLNYELNLSERSTRFYEMFQSLIHKQGWQIPDDKLALDLGCGTGTGLQVLAKDFEHVVGVDIKMSSLLIAKKFLEESNIQNVTLIHASAHKLPFDKEQFDFAMSINVLEHVFTPDTMLREMAAVLKSGGVFCGDSRNRYDLFFPEPHVKLRWVGFLPRQWMEPYVRWRLGVGYDHTYLLSYHDLKSALREAFDTSTIVDNQWAIAFPNVTAYGVSPTIQQQLSPILKLSLIQPFLLHIFPSHIALARKG
ncbi:MAG: class I SAM-dependent methyltransferase [Chloroflexota bacterium]